MESSGHAKRRGVSIMRSKEYMRGTRVRGEMEIKELVSYSRMPVPQPDRAIMPKTVAVWPWYSAHVRTEIPVASMIEPRKRGWKVWRG